MSEHHPACKADVSQLHISSCWPDPNPVLTEHPHLSCLPMKNYAVKMLSFISVMERAAPMHLPLEPYIHTKSCCDSSGLAGVPDVMMLCAPPYINTQTPKSRKAPLAASWTNNDSAL